MEKSVYVFMGEDAQFPSGVFADFDIARQWIEKYSLSGVLTEMPINMGVYDWAILMKYFEPKKEHQKEARFIQRFSSALLEHWHCEDGQLLE